MKAVAVEVGDLNTVIDRWAGRLKGYPQPLLGGLSYLSVNWIETGGEILSLFLSLFVFFVFFQFP